MIPNTEATVKRNTSNKADILNKNILAPSDMKNSKGSSAKRNNTCINVRSSNLLQQKRNVESNKQGTLSESLNEDNRMTSLNKNKREDLKQKKLIIANEARNSLAGEDTYCTSSVSKDRKNNDPPEDKVPLANNTS